MHVYVRLSGWGIQVLPEADFDATWNEEQGCLDLTLSDGKFARIHVDGSGYQSQVDVRTTKSLDEVAAISSGEANRYWNLETCLYRFVWPAGYRIVCRADQAPTVAVDLLGPNNECIFIQNPRAMPPLERMVGPDQTMLDQDDAARSVLLGYTLDGVDWRQRHIVVTVGSRELAVTGQAPVLAFGAVERAMRKVVASIEGTPSW